MTVSPLSPMGRAGRTFAALALATVALAACAGEPTPTPTPSVSTPAAPQPTPTPEAPALQPDGDAAANLPFFAQTVQGVWDSGAGVAGRAYVDALAAAGFDKAAMQVTDDETTLGNPVESLQFSVRWNEECLIGQVGPETGDPVAVVLPVIEGDRCLVGDTRTIDW
ncbi:hypothetical protein RYJ27_05140 [Microbacterium limosum]|uniref:DUF6993 domain-containing protein n=1 Tax=Microbacterium limosum TaxID=3079935 RepID=A0AAU0MJX1_9MICO|nr:hypothetical protein [Microbacterium sp. Y20]WOQ70590.1 hypothetical protein RYJ27_05140 [Microbacterium sp. Y20]